ncbi:MAG TPA: hypothetical protein VII41_07540, partial [Steroidobacteraceae bacterium]
GAHGKCTRIERDGLVIERSTRPREPRRYLAALAQAGAPERHAVPALELPFEYLLNALRLNEGFEQCEFESRTGLAMSVIDAQLAQALRRGLLEHSATRWRASAQGFNFLNDLLGLFLPSGMTASLGQEQVPQNFPVRTTAWA